MEIDINSLIEKSKKEELNIIDIRGEYDYLIERILNAKNIPVNRLMQEPERYLNHKDTYYIYCQSGRNSRQVVSILNSRGYNTINIKDGFMAYKSILR